MDRLFLRIFDFFSSRRWILHVLLVVLLVLMSFLSIRLRFVEDITAFFGDDGQSAMVFEHLKSKDRLAFMLSWSEGVPGEEDLDRLVAMADSLAERLQPLVREGFLRAFSPSVGPDDLLGTIDFIYDHLPVLLTDLDYERLARISCPDSLVRILRRHHEVLASPMGIGAAGLIQRDPLGLGLRFFEELQALGQGVEYELYDGRIFDRDMRTLVFFVSTVHPMGETGLNGELVARVERELTAFSSLHPEVEVSYFGAPAVAAYNARQIKRDVLLTSGIALLVILLVLLASFRNRWFIPLLLSPAVFAFLFALSVVYLLQGQISAIAVGAGAAIVGIVLSYAIHVIVHSSHTTDPRSLVRELAAPLTIGSLTTIGAFLALIFAESRLLREFGLFASLALLGTILYCLIWLPHYLQMAGRIRPGRLLERVHRMVSYPFERNRWLVASILLITAVSLFFYGRVSVDSDLNSINFMPESLLRAQDQLFSSFGDDSRDVFIVARGDDTPGAVRALDSLVQTLAPLEREGLVGGLASVSSYVVPPAEQRARIARWTAYWAEDNRASRFQDMMRTASVQAGFQPHAFDTFLNTLSGPEPEAIDYSPGVLSREMPLLDDWIHFTAQDRVLMARIRLEAQDKATVYERVEPIEGISIIDRAYYSSRMTEMVNKDFSYILWVSGLLVFLVLLLSYGRLELALLSIAPMVISWVIILGMMGLVGLQFNIVNIILATFIFGMGDDFSIFIMDGLLEENRCGRKTLQHHKTAIFFSAFTVIVGLGVLIFAQHPSLRSIALISLLGMAIVLLVSYTLQPVIFHLLVTRPQRNGGQPYTLVGFLTTVYSFSLFLIFCFVGQVLVLVYPIVPVPRRWKERLLRLLMHTIGLLIVYGVPLVKFRREGLYRGQFKRPCILIANHQSFVDILCVLSLSPRILLVTNDWVWRSPIFGRIVRYAGCVNADGQPEGLRDALRLRVEEGCSIAVFPEGTRSEDGTVGRFHKGAFYLAKELELDILPLVISGAGHVSSKRQGMYIKPGRIIVRAYPRRAFDDPRVGGTLRDQAKWWRRWFAHELHELELQLERPSNPHFRDALRKQYVFKGRGLARSVRARAWEESYFECWDRLIPRTARVTDVGSGFGELALMLGMVSRRREVTGLEADRERLAVSEHLAGAVPNVRFELADMRAYRFEPQDAFIFDGSLSHIPVTSQLEVLRDCARQLPPDGQILIREEIPAPPRGRHLSLSGWLRSRILAPARGNPDERELFPLASIITLAEELDLELHQETGCPSRFGPSVIHVMRRRP